jgi:hypothetical protein
MRKHSKPTGGNHRVFTAMAARQMGDFRAIKRDWSARLFRGASQRGHGARALASAVTPAPEWNVVGVGIGEKLVNDRPTGVRCLKFLVRAKYPESQMSDRHLLPKAVDGIPTDVEEVGLFRKFPLKTSRRRRRAVPAAEAMPNPRVRMRPAQPGCSIGFRDPGDQFVMAGTFGALVTDGDHTSLLSNNHVLADEGRLPAGAPIFQPGLLDGGNPDTDQIAELTRFEPLQAGAPNKVDCAMARALRLSLVSNAILFIGPPAGVAPAADDMVVHKFGRTTGYRAGRITSIDTDVTVTYETGNYTFEGQIIIVGLNDQPFSDAGDSGSLILERATQKAVALLFAGSSTHTIANHIEDVLQAMQVTLA